MTTELNQQNKQLVWDFWQSLDKAEPNQIREAVQTVMANDLTWHGPDAINRLDGAESYIAEFWQPLLRSFPDLKRQTHLFCGGQSNGRIDGNIDLDGRMWVSGTGYLTGTFVEDYLTIPATGGQVQILSLIHI